MYHLFDILFTSLCIAAWVLVELIHSSPDALQPVSKLYSNMCVLYNLRQEVRDQLTTFNTVEIPLSII